MCAPCTSTPRVAHSCNGSECLSVRRDATEGTRFADAYPYQMPHALYEGVLELSFVTDAVQHLHVTDFKPLLVFVALQQPRATRHGETSMLQSIFAWRSHWIMSWLTHLVDTIPCRAKSGPQDVLQLLGAANHQFKIICRVQIPRTGASHLVQISPP